MAVPAAPTEAGTSKLGFAIRDNAGTNEAVLQKAYQVGTTNATTTGDFGVYPTSGLPGTGYKVTTASTEIAISSTSVPCQGVIVKADPDNAEDVWVGATGITTTKATTDGYRLAPGESVGMPCRNANTVFIRRGAATDVGVYWAASRD